MKLGDRLKYIIDTLGISQVKFAKALGVSANYISLIVNGKKENISDTLAKLIEETYNFSANWLLTGAGEPRIANDISKKKADTIKKISFMSDKELDTILAFLKALEEIQNNEKTD